MSPSIQELRNAFASIIIRRRESRGWSQEDFAEISGVERSYITRMEQGNNTPTLATIFKLSKALKIKPKRLVREVEDELERMKEKP